MFCLRFILPVCDHGGAAGSLPAARKRGKDMSDQPKSEVQWQDRVKPGLTDHEGTPWMPESLDDPGLCETEVAPEGQSWEDYEASL